MEEPPISRTRKSRPGHPPRGRIGCTGWAFGTVFYGVLAAVAWAWRSGLVRRTAVLRFAWKRLPTGGSPGLPDLALGLGAANGLGVVGLSALSTARTRLGRAPGRPHGRAARRPVPFSHALVARAVKRLRRGTALPRCTPASRVGWFVASLLFGRGPRGARAGTSCLGPFSQFSPGEASSAGSSSPRGISSRRSSHTSVVNGINLPLLARRGRELRAAALRPSGRSSVFGRSCVSWRAWMRYPTSINSARRSAALSRRRPGLLRYGPGWRRQKRTRGLRRGVFSMQYFD